MALCLSEAFGATPLRGIVASEKHSSLQAIDVALIVNVIKELEPSIFDGNWDGIVINLLWREDSFLRALGGVGEADYGSRGVVWMTDGNLYGGITRSCGLTVSLDLHFDQEQYCGRFRRNEVRLLT